MYLSIVMKMILSHRTHPMSRNEVLQSNDLGPLLFFNSILFVNCDIIIACHGNYL